MDKPWSEQLKGGAKSITPTRKYLDSSAAQAPSHAYCTSSKEQPAAEEDLNS